MKMSTNWSFSVKTSVLIDDKDMEEYILDKVQDC